MSDNFQKFLFLGALILSVLWSSQFLKNKGSASSEWHFSLNNLTSSGDLSSSRSLLGESSLSGSQPSLPVEQSSTPSLNGAPALPVFYHIGQESPPTIGARIVLIADLETGDNYYGYDDNQRWPLASLTKLATAALAMKNLDPNSTVVLQKSDLADASEIPVPYLEAGDEYSINDLLKILLLASRNEAAVAISRFYGPAKFVEDLNGWAQSLNLNSTYFEDPSGLSVSNQSTADDLLILTREIYNQLPDIFRVTREKQALVTELNSRKSYVVASIDPFAGQANFLGGKTGYTDEADGNLLTIISYENRPVVFVVLGSGDRFGNSQKLISWFERNYHK